MATQVAVKEREITNLAPIDTLRVKEELALVDPKSIKADTKGDQELELKTDEYAELLVNFDVADFRTQESRKASVEAMGLSLQRQAARKSKMLQEPIKKLSQRGADGGEVANALIGLKLKVEELDPNKLDLEPGWFSRLISRLPFMGTPLKRYFTQFESGQVVIDAVIRSLEMGQEQLKRDNTILAEDQVETRELTFKLEKAIKMGQLLDAKITQKLEALDPDSPKHKFIQEELLFPLRQRIVDLQQQLVVNQQGVLATEIVVRNNKELVRGVNRALNVTISALEVAVKVALALANQKIVLDKINALNTTTSDLIRGTAGRLRTQGVEIHKQASSSMLNMEALKAAFTDLRAALDDVSNYRVQALDQMHSTISELNRMTDEGETAIKQMEEGNRARPVVEIEAE